MDSANIRQSLPVGKLLRSLGISSQSSMADHTTSRLNCAPISTLFKKHWVSKCETRAALLPLGAAMG